MTNDQPICMEAQRITDTWSVLPGWLPVPGAGQLAVNSFLLRGKESLLVDTGAALFADSFMQALENEIDLNDLRWIWLSHLDADHSGNLIRVLEAAPKASVITNFLGKGKLSMTDIDMSRVQLIDESGRLAINGKTLRAMRPTYYDAPESMGFIDQSSGVLFVVDAFGALLQDRANGLGEVGAAELRDGLLAWSVLDAPWLRQVDSTKLGRALQSIRRLAPQLLLSAHLPWARNYEPLLTEIAQAYIELKTDYSDSLQLDVILDEILTAQSA